MCRWMMEGDMKVKQKWMKGEMGKGKKKPENISKVEGKMDERREGKKEKEIRKYLES